MTPLDNLLNRVRESIQTLTEAYQDRAGVMSAVADSLQIALDAAQGTVPEIKVDKNETYHESFGIVQMNKVTGNRHLYGSSLSDHYTWIEVSVSRAVTLHKDDRIMEDTPWPKQEVVRFCLSAAQFADVITHMNQGNGIACTLTRVNGQGMERCPEESQTPMERIRNKAVQGTDDRVKEVVQNLNSIQKMVDESKLTNKAKEDIKSLITQSKNKLDRGFVTYMMDRLSESADKVVTQAKIEVDAMVGRIIERTGIEAIKKQYKNAQLDSGDSVEVKLLDK